MRRDPGAVAVSDRDVPGPHGPVPIRMYATESAPIAGLVWIHGGAFMYGDLDIPEADWVSRSLAAEGIAVVSVDYRLATDGVHFPVPSDDCLAAWTWVVDAEPLGVPAASWHIGGGSAGGNLAASVSRQARDGAARLPASSVLIYPVLHSELPAPSASLAAALETIPPHRRFPPGESHRLNINYVGDESLLRHPDAYPGHGDVVGLPPTLIVNSDVDDLRPSGEAFGAALAIAGVDVAIVREPGVLHGHLNEPSSPGAVRTVARIVDWIRGVAVDSRGDTESIETFH